MFFSSIQIPPYVEIGGGLLRYQNWLRELKPWQWWIIKVLMALVLIAVYHNSLRVCTYLLWAALVPPSLLLWRKLYDKGDSSSFLHVIGLTHKRLPAASSTLLFLSVTSFAGNAGVGCGHFHQMGC